MISSRTASRAGPNFSKSRRPTRSPPACAASTRRATSLYFIDSRGRDTGALTTLDLKTGEQKVVAADDRADVGGVMVHPTENTIQAVSFTYDRIRWQFFDKAVEADFKYLKTVADGDITVTSRTLDDRQWIVAFLMDNGPVRYYHYDRPTKKERFLFTNRDELAKWPLQKMHPVVIRSRDGLTWSAI